MLEIVGKENASDGCEFAVEMTKLHVDTINKINAIAEKHGIDPFETIKIFGFEILQCGADLRAKFNVEHGDIFADSGENNEENEGGKS